MPVDATLEAVIRRDRRVVVTALIAVIDLSWTSPRVSALCRKRSFDFVDFEVSERPLWRKAVIDLCQTNTLIRADHQSPTRSVA